MTDIFTSVSLKSLTAPAVATATVTSSAIEVTGYTGTNFYVFYGNSADTLSDTVYWTASLKECATESGTYTAVAADDVSGPSTNAFGLVNAPTEDQQIYGIGYTGSLDFVKVVVTATGTHTTGTPIGIFCALGLPRSQTTDQDYNP